MRRRPIAGAADPRITNIVPRQGVMMPQRSRGMDAFLSDEDRAVLYERWHTDWPTPISLQGGGQLVTVAVVADLPWKELSKVYGTKRAKVFRDIALAQTGE